MLKNWSIKSNKEKDNSEGAAGTPYTSPWKRVTSVCQTLYVTREKEIYIPKKRKNHHDNPVKMFPVLNKVIALFCFCWIKFAARLNSFWFCGAEIMRLCWKIFWGEYYFLILLFPLSQKTQKKTEPEECNLVLRDIFAVCLLNTTLIRELSLEYSYLQRCENCHE